MPRLPSKMSSFVRLAIVCSASMVVLVPTSAVNIPSETESRHLDRRSIQMPSSNNPRDPCKVLPITPDTWKLLNIDNVLQSQGNITIAQYATMNQAGNFIGGIGENPNAGQLCHPIKAPAWQILYAIQEYNNLMNAMTDSINYAMSQLQAVSAAMVNDLFPNVTESRFMMNLKWLFADLYRGLAYGSVALLITVWASLGMTPVYVILGATAIGLTWASLIQGPPHTVSFEPWTKLSFYIAQVQGNLNTHITQAMTDVFAAPINSEKGIAKVLQQGAFFTPPTPAGLMDNMETAIIRTVQSRLLSRMLREENAFVTISEDECKGPGPDGAKGTGDILSFCDPKEKLLYNVLRAGKKKTHSRIPNASAIVNKYGFSAEFIVKTSWECQKKYGGWEHDTFSDLNKVRPEDLTSNDCIINLPVCDMRLDMVRHIKFDKEKTVTVACRKGAGLPI